MDTIPSVFSPKMGEPKTIETFEKDQASNLFPWKHGMLGVPHFTLW